MHTARSRILSLPALATLALALLGGLVSPANAQDGVRIARACVMQIQEAVEDATDRQHQVTRRTVEAIRAGVEEGAPDRVLRAIAEHGLDRVRAIGVRADGAIETLAGECVRRLRELGADRSLINAVRVGAARADEQLEDSTQRSSRVIRSALMRALD
ncbi:MAG: hypothetical protein ACF8Q5_12870 [Phycisphaerales bacterium JB040]